MSEKTNAEQWSSAADGWARWAAIRDALVPATEKMLDIAAIAPASRVLDIGCGSGEQTIMAAKRVGETGHVLATDIAAPMIADTEKNVAAAGIRNVSTRVCSAEALAESSERFDAAISRFVLMLIPDPVATARAVLAVLRPGGTFAAMVHGDPEKNPFNALSTDILARHGGKTINVNKPGFFALADHARLGSVLRNAGFADVAVSSMPIVRRLDNTAAAVAMIRESWAFCQALVADLPPTAQVAAWAEVEQALTRFQSADGFVIPGEINLVVGRKSAG